MDPDHKAPMDTEVAGSDTERGTVVQGPGEMKRDLSRRHINMIGLAGMIVSHPQWCMWYCSWCYSYDQ